MERVVFLLTCIVTLANAADNRPNFVWLHVESTDGRTWQQDMHDLVPIPNIKSLQERGTNFKNTYADVPICCPSRASVWSGRRPHNLPHTTNGMHVGGAWNNYEGFGLANTTFDKLKISDRLAKENYTVRIAGKEDWLSGDHSLTTMVDSFSIYARWPYNIPEEGGFHIWGECGRNITVNPGNQSGHKGDWNTLNEQVPWIRDLSSQGATAQQPFFLYQGMNIVHPPYHTDEEHLARIPVDKVKVPEWPSLDSHLMHPCDMQVSMKKGCLVPGLGLNTTHHKRMIRAVYYAMIAEFDDMVGEYMKAVEDAHLLDRTIFIVSSDHGDMQMEHAQFYKMVAYEASSRVPLVIAGPGVNHNEVNTLVTLVDLMPTFLDLASAPMPRKVSGPGGRDEDPEAVDGESLVPLLKHGDAASASHRDHIVSQFHGENLAMSWYMVRRGELKYVAWGTGKEHHPQLFNLTADPDEWSNLADPGMFMTDPAQRKLYQAVIEDMDALLRKSIDYPSVTREVARYNLRMAEWWMNTEPNWRGVLNGTHEGSWPQPPDKNVNATLNPEWGDLWREHNDLYFAAWNKWSLNQDVLIPKCPATTVHNWPADVVNVLV